MHEQRALPRVVFKTMKPEKTRRTKRGDLKTIKYGVFAFEAKTPTGTIKMSQKEREEVRAN
jgi:hypothetical protein